MDAREGSVDLAGRTALVTGGARGIGAGIATALAAAGCRVWLLDRDRDALEARARTIGAAPIVADVRNPSQLADAGATIGLAAPQLDILVNNAGLMTTGPFERTDAAAWQALLDTNVGGIFHCVQQFAPRMSVGGSIVNIASVSAERGGGAVGNVWYGATKAAVVAMTKGLARELGARGIRVNAVSPGVVDTDLTRHALTDEVRRRSLMRFPLGRITEIDDIADAVLYLCSPAARFVTGAVLAVDGGFLTT